MKLIRTATAAVAAMTLVFSSCTNDSKLETITEQPYNLCFNHITDLNTGAEENLGGVSYMIRTNYTKGVFDVEISGLRIGSYQYPTLTLTGIPFQQHDDGTRTGKIDQLIPSASGLSQVPTFYNFNISVCDRLLDENYVPVIAISYNLDLAYNVVVMPKSLYFTGNSVSDNGQGTRFTNVDAWYLLQFNAETNTFDITLGNAKFMQQQPAMDMIFKAIPYTVSADGKLSFAIDALTPYIKNTPFPQYPITDLGGTAVIDGALDFSFKCTPGNATTSGVTFDVVCHGEQIPK